jgi:hypothetical protein
MSGHQKNCELDNYDAEIVEGLPEQFDVSRYRKQGSGVSTDSSSVILKPIPRYTNFQPPDSNNVEEPRYFDKNPYGFEKVMNRSYEQPYQNPLLHQMAINQVQQPNLMVYPRPIRPTVYPRHGSMLPNFILNQPNQQMPRFSNQNHLSYPISVFEPGSQTNMQQPQQTPVDPQNTADYNARKPNKYPSDGKLVDTPTNKCEYENDRDESRYGIHRSRRKSKTEEKSRSSSLSSFHNLGLKTPETHKIDKKIHYNVDSDGESVINDENQRNSSIVQLKPDSGFRLAYSTSNQDHSYNALKSNLKTRKSGVKFDEKLEVFEISNPHYGTDIKSEKREMKKKKKDKKKEDETIMKAKFDLKAKVQQKKSQLFYVIPHYFLFIFH